MFNSSVLLVLCAFVTISLSFPDGGPPDTCVKERFNQPNHGKARTQPLDSLPYEIRATADNYQPGQQIQVTIRGSEYFRGFFLQARDADTNEWIGSWQESQNTKSIPECASITHADNRDKEGANLIWNAPQHKSGRVYFTGTVLKSYSTFWADVVAKIPVYQNQQQK